jgi:hypothetical protein
MTDSTDPSVKRRQPDGEVVLTLQELLSAERPPVPETKPIGGPSTESSAVREIGGRKNGLEPTRYGDWEKDGRCIDF